MTLQKSVSAALCTHRRQDRNAILALVTCWYSNLAANDCQSQKISFSERDKNKTLHAIAGEGVL
jgi:hypothetical protein